MNIAVIGIGQSLRGDDGIGPEAVRRWITEFPADTQDPRIQTRLLETPGLGLIDYLQECDAAILVDAVSTGGSEGAVRIFESTPETMLTPAEKTAHGFGVVETLSLARKSGIQLPSRLILIGIEGHHYELGRSLSGPVREAIPKAVEAIQEKVSQLMSTKNTR
jgi:hydrogenase maturation protease